MTLHRAEKVVIITEKLIAKGVFEVIRQCGATGYTFMPAGGQGSRNVRSVDTAMVVDDFANLKIEVIAKDEAMAEAIMDQVTERYFQDYSGITYREPVDVLRTQKFSG